MLSSATRVFKPEGNLSEWRKLISEEAEAVLLVSHPWDGMEGMSLVRETDPQSLPEL